MLKVTQLFLIISWGIVNGGGLDLPSYIHQCSLSDPKLNECLVKRANEVIPIITKGDVFYNIPSVFPVFYAEAPIVCTGLTYILYNASSYDWNTLRIVEMAMDLKYGKITFVSVMKKLEVLAEDYTITEGKMLDIPVSGHGKYNSTFTNVKIKYHGNLRFFKKGEDVYLEYFDSGADMSCDQGYFYLENLQSTEKDDVNAYMNEHWEELVTQIKPAYEGYFKAFVRYLLEPILNAVPFNKVFLP